MCKILYDWHESISLEKNSNYDWERYKNFYQGKQTTVLSLLLKTVKIFLWQYTVGI